MKVSLAVSVYVKYILSIFRISIQTCVETLRKKGKDAYKIAHIFRKKSKPYVLLILLQVNH